jgi:hypothetical protein
MNIFVIFIGVVYILDIKSVNIKPSVGVLFIYDKSVC